MALSESGPEPTVQHVPRWKQLGLKLKNGPDLQQNLSISDTRGPNLGPETNGSANFARELPLKKKRRLDDSTVPPSDQGSKQSNQSRATNVEALYPKKKVSFTADTKPPDGALNDDATETSLSSDLKARKPPSTKESKRRLKPAKQMKRNKSTQESPRKSTDALDYLHLYRDNRSKWKFNKNREIWILKHALSQNDIPAEYESALLDYIRGLQSSGARNRLKEECLKAQATKDTPMTNGIDETDTQGSKEEPKPNQNDEHSDSLRSTVLLQCLSEEVGFHEEPSTASKVRAPPTSTPRETNEPPILQQQEKKKKKNRTVVVEMSESSSSSSSSSSEDSDDGQGMLLSMS